MPTVISRTVTGEAESYSNSVAGIDIEAVRAGAGDDHVVAGYIRSATPGSRWCKIDLKSRFLGEEGLCAAQLAVEAPTLRGSATRPFAFWFASRSEVRT